MTAQRRRGTAAALVVLVLAMGGLAFAAVPLYRLFCEVTGYGGTTQRAAAAPDRVAATEIRVRLNADVAPGLEWDFAPIEHEVALRPGEERIVHYRAHNRSAAERVGTATFNVTPQKAGIYFNKIECFCFTEQRLGPGESIEMPVSFFVDPAMLEDPSTRDVRTITLSYTMFRAKSAPPRVAETPR